MFKQKAPASEGGRYKAAATGGVVSKYRRNRSALYKFNAFLCAVIRSKNAAELDSNARKKSPKWFSIHQESEAIAGKAILPYNRDWKTSMTKLKVTAKGQVTLKRDLLEHLGVTPGEKIEANKLPDGRIVVWAAAQDGRIADFVGCLARRAGRKLTITQMKEIAAQGWSNKK